MLRNWDDLPEFMKTIEVRPYWEILNKKRGQLILKRIFDLIDTSPEIDRILHSRGRYRPPDAS